MSREYAASDAVARLEHDHAHPGCGQLDGCGEASDSGSDNYDWLILILHWDFDAPAGITDQSCLAYAVRSIRQRNH
jgi:hypothetical protein